MDRNAYRDDDDGGEGAGQPDAYWRRRAITLALGLGLLGVLAWGFSGGGGKPAQTSSSGTLSATALGTAVPGLPGLSSATSSGTSGGTPAGTPTGSPAAGAAVSPSPASLVLSPSASRLRTMPSPSPSPSARQSPAPAPGAGPGAAPGGRCAPGAVVLSLFSDRYSYGPSQFPRFDVYAVSTSSGSCAFDPGQLQVVVLSAGRIVWDSADCARGAGRIAELTRGVPAQDAVVWNRAITLPGCQVLAPFARLGSYSVQARTATVQSPARAFKLTG
jgi:hypothetical protein